MSAHKLIGDKSCTGRNQSFGRTTREGPSSYRQHDGLRLHQEDRGHTLCFPVSGESETLARSRASRCERTEPVLAVVRGQSRGRFSVSSSPGGLGFPAPSSRCSTNVLSVSGQTDAGRFCDQQDEPVPTVHDLGAGRVRGRPELSRLLLGSGNLAVSPGPTDPSCAARSRGTADRGDSHLPGLETGSVVASSFQDVGSAHPAASSRSEMPELPRIHNTSGIQYGPSSGSSHQWQPLIESGDSVVLNQDDFDFLDHHISTNTKQKYGSAWQQFCTFCSGLNVQPITCSVAVIVKYIRHRFEEGASYSTMNVAKSAISKYHCFLPGNTPVGTDQLVQKAMKSFFKLRPPLPKYRSTFDVTIVMRYVMDMGPVAVLDLKCLTYKTLFLVAFSTLSRYWHSALLLSLVTTRNHLYPVQYCV